MDHVRLLARLFWQPGAAMSDILDRGSLLFASAAVCIVSFLLGRSGLAISFYAPLLVLAVFYVPGALMLSKLLAGLRGSPSDVFQRDYSSLLTCTGMAWTAANLPLVLAAWIGPIEVLLYLAAPVYLYFAVLMFFAVRTVFGAENRQAVAVVGLSWIPLVAAFFVWGPLRFLLGWIASPFFLFFAYYYLASEFRSLGGGLRSRQNFHRMLQAAAVNPHDGEAQYQLGLIYQQRRQYSEAIQRFKNAIAIDPTETDAHFQLGRMARQQGRLHDALAHFQQVLDQDEHHSQSEILRELGAMYVTVRQFEDARHMLADYIERRPYDPEGLYYYGQALEGLNRMPQAREMYARAVEADRTAPRYRRRVTARWSRLAQKALKRAV
ncbi:MAG TPA: tetratricopeptide repeat protein [Bryobacteraceae bacterium]|nr:tetratricopeptide repeat protein [Bryobacteraceae bacterium]